MSSAKLSLLSAVAAILLTSAWSTWLRHERTSEARALRVANAELLRQAALQHQASAARSHSPDTAEPVSSENAPPAAPAPRAHPGRADYRDQGQATPLDALQTMAWAADRGDVDRMMNLITFDPAARPKVAAYRASLPPDAQAQWPTVEVLAATLLTSRGISHPYPHADLLARATLETITADRVLVRLPGTPKDREVYQKLDDTWKWVITEALVDEYLERLAQKPGP